MTTSMIDGGMRMPNVPAEAMTPMDNRLSYPAASMGGSEIRDSRITEAPTTPIGAARMVPMIMTATARPPGVRRSITWVASSMSLATPLRSSSAPMKMNMGNETSTGSTATPPHMRSRMLFSLTRLNSPSPQPIRAKINPVPPST